jgi:hypothetical protein
MSQKFAFGASRFCAFASEDFDQVEEKNQRGLLAG